MGYHDYSELSYVRMNRIGYGPEDIKRFRDQVAHDVVPELQKVIALKNKRTGIQHPTFADLPVAFKDGNPKPIEATTPGCPPPAPCTMSSAPRQQSSSTSCRTTSCSTSRAAPQDVRRLHDQPAFL